MWYFSAVIAIVGYSDLHNEMSTSSHQSTFTDCSTDTIIRGGVIFSVRCHKEWFHMMNIVVCYCIHAYMLTIYLPSPHYTLAFCWITSGHELYLS